MLVTLLLIGMACHVESFNSSFCIGKSTGYYAYPESCAKFYNCANGATYLQDCAQGTEWRQDALTCDHPSVSGCTTQQAPLTSTSPAAQTSTQTDVTTQALQTDVTTLNSQTDVTTLNSQTDVTTLNSQTDVTTLNSQTDVSTEAATPSPNSTSSAWQSTGGWGRDGRCGSLSFSRSAAPCPPTGPAHPLPDQLQCAFFCARMPDCTSFRYEGSMCQLLTC